MNTSAFPSPAQKDGSGDDCAGSRAGNQGIVAKRTDSIYQPGKRTGSWTKHRISLGQEFVIGGYVPSNLGVDSLVIGFYRGSDLRIRGARACGLCTRYATPSLRTNQTPEDGPLPVCQPSRKDGRAMGTGTHRRKDEGVRVAETGGRGADRVS